MIKDIANFQVVNKYPLQNGSGYLVFDYENYYDPQIQLSPDNWTEIRNVSEPATWKVKYRIFIRSYEPVKSVTVNMLINGKRVERTVFNILKPTLYEPKLTTKPQLKYREIIYGTSIVNMPYNATLKFYIETVSVGGGGGVYVDEGSQVVIYE